MQSKDSNASNISNRLISTWEHNFTAFDLRSCFNLVVPFHFPYYFSKSTCIVRFYFFDRKQINYTFNWNCAFIVYTFTIRFRLRNLNQCNCFWQMHFLAVKRLPHITFDIQLLMVLFDSSFQSYANKPIQLISCYRFRTTVIIDGSYSFPFPLFSQISMSWKGQKPSIWWKSIELIYSVHVRPNQKILSKNISVFETKI